MESTLILGMSILYKNIYINFIMIKHLLYFATSKWKKKQAVLYRKYFFIKECRFLINSVFLVSEYSLNLCFSWKINIWCLFALIFVLFFNPLFSVFAFINVSHLRQYFRELYIKMNIEINASIFLRINFDSVLGIQLVT